MRFVCKHWPGAFISSHIISNSLLLPIKVVPHMRGFKPHLPAQSKNSNARQNTVRKNHGMRLAIAQMSTQTLTKWKLARSHSKVEGEAWLHMCQLSWTLQEYHCRVSTWNSTWHPERASEWDRYQERKGRKSETGTKRGEGRETCINYMIQQVGRAHTNTHQTPTVVHVRVYTQAPMYLLDG